MIANKRIMKYLLLFLALVFANHLPAQDMTASIELKSVVTDSNASLSFIKQQTVEFEFDRLKLFQNLHSLSMFSLNRKLKIDLQYKFCDIPVTGVFALLKNSGFCTYLLIDSTKNFIKTITNFLGQPENVSASDLKKGEFDFLSWRINGLEIVLMNDRFSNYANQVTNKIILAFTNMKFEEIISKDKVF